MSAREEGAPKLNRWSKPEYERLNAADGMPPQTYSGIRAVRGIPVAAADGTVLLTDHVFPTQAKDSVVLIRTPYGRKGLNGVARMIAERGHHIVIQACRGTDGSGTPPFEPMVHEASDGQAALAWLRAQPWATGMVQSFGASYIGLTQWAEGNGPLRPDAMAVSLSSRRFDEAIIYPGGGFCMETAVVWDYSLDLQTRPLPAQLWRLWRAQPRVRQASLTVPPEDAARVAVGHESPFFRSWMAHSEPGDPWWEPLHFSPHPEDLPPVTILAGWQDLFLQGGFRDFADLTAAGTTVLLIAGDWTHHEGNQGVSAARALLQQFDDPGLIARSAAVSLTTSGVATERTFSQWPPPATPRTWFPTAGGSYPAAVEDAIAALTELHNEAERWGVDVDRLGVGGGSAGGHISAVTALRLAAAGRAGHDVPRLALLLLEVPAVDMSLDWPSMHEFAGDDERAGALAVVQAYLGGHEPDAFFSPLEADDYTGMPRTLVMTAELDPLRDPAEAFVPKLQAAGISAELYRGIGQLHGTQALTGAVESSRLWQARAIRELRERLAGDAG